jgi:dienelactone hydrolase
MTLLTRRAAIACTLAASLRPPSAWAADAPHEAKKPLGWTQDTFEGRTFFRRGTSPRAVVLLHELNGLSPECIAFGAQLVEAGFTVFMPLLFGHPEQNSIFLGTIESCIFGGFHCLAEGKPEQDTAPVRWTRSFVNELNKRTEITSIGVIGMCQSGSFPLATMTQGSKVRAVIMSQPALPIGKIHASNTGIARTTIETAQRSQIPILAFRFKKDTLCREDRLQALKALFPTRFTCHEFDCLDMKMKMSSHNQHAVLTGACVPIRTQARLEAIAFLKDKLA